MTGALRFSEVTPTNGPASPHPKTCPSELVIKNPFPVGDDAIPVHDPIAPFRLVQPISSGCPAWPNAVAKRYALTSQYPFPLGVEAIASHPKAALRVLGG
jgi:hypothetical protein